LTRHHFHIVATQHFYLTADIELSKRSRLSSWMPWSWGQSKAEPAQPTGPVPTFVSDPAPSASSAYEDGLYMLAGSGMRKVSRAMLFAGCAYGPRFMRFLGVPTKQTTHEEFIVEQCGIPRADLLLCDFTSSAMEHPGYFLALDRSSRQVLLVIRGSSAWHDALTDLTCSFTRHVSGSFGSKGHAEGSCHEGMHAEIGTVVREAPARADPPGTQGESWL